MTERTIPGIPTKIDFDDLLVDDIDENSGYEGAVGAIIVFEGGIPVWSSTTLIVIGSWVLGEGVLG